MKTSSSFCPKDAVKNNTEATGISYVRDEIDKSVMDELPDDIRNEIKQFLGVSKQQVKRTSNGIQKYTVSQSGDDTKLKQPCDAAETSVTTESKQKYDNITEDTTTVVSPSDEFTPCSKCRQQIRKSKMDEHTDFHFALDLQKRGRMTLDSMQTQEPPKKRKKGKISNFFVSGGR